VREQVSALALARKQELAPGLAWLRVLFQEPE
jgi:hypothetical protein